MKEILTNSRKGSFQRCRKRHWFEYEMRLRPEEEAKALRIGHAVHAGIDKLKKGAGLDAAHAAVRAVYATAPVGQDVLQWDYEQMTCLCLVSGWAWRWGENGGLRIVASEAEFRVPLTNPDTGKPTPNFDFGGVIDGLVAIETRVSILEHKTCSEDIDENSSYWPRLQMDSQVSLYVGAARKLYDCVTGVLYDVIRKPSIRPESVPIVDEKGYKIVLGPSGERVYTKDGKKPRETGDTEKGYVLQTRPMTAAEWGDKLTADIGSRPNFYYARKELARTDDEVLKAQGELWDVQKDLVACRANDRWYRTVHRDTCTFCPFFHLCTSRTDVSETVPPGFVRVDNVNQELST